MQLFAHNTGVTSMPDFYGIDEEHQNVLYEALEDEKLTDMEKYSIIQDWLKSENNIHTPLYKCSACGESYYKMKVNFLLIGLLSLLKLNETKLIKYNKLSEVLKKSWNVFNFYRINKNNDNKPTTNNNDNDNMEVESPLLSPSINNHIDIYHLIYKFGFKVEKSELRKYYDTSLKEKYHNTSYDNFIKHKTNKISNYQILIDLYLNNCNNPPIMNNLLFIETESSDYEYIFPICTNCQLLIKKKDIYAHNSYMIANNYDFGCVDVFDNIETINKKENVSENVESQQSFSVNQSQEHTSPYYQKYSQLSDKLFLNVVDNAFITPSRIYGQVLKLTSSNDAVSGMLAIKGHIICFENLYESKLPFSSNNSNVPIDILPNFSSLTNNVYQAMFIGKEEQFETIKSTGSFKNILNKLCLIHIDNCKFIMNILRQVIIYY
jgi:hypothetical protein